MKKTIILSIAIICIVTGAIVFFLHRGEEEITVAPGRIVALEPMAKLCATEIYIEVPVKDTINQKVIFAIQKQRGQITFDLEKLTFDPTADTIRITLPHPTIELNESTDPNSWEVIDTKAIGKNAMFRSGKFTVEEENAAKARAKQKTIARLRQNGTISRAKEEAAASLQSFLETIYRKPVIILQEK